MDNNDFSFNKPKKKKFNALTFVITFFLIISLTITYAALDEELNVSGEAIMTPEMDARIYGVSFSEAIYGTSNYSPTFTKDTLSTSVTLSELNGTVSYVLTLRNFGNTNMTITSSSFTESNNTDITYEISESFPITIDAGVNNKQITVTFKYKDEVSSLPVNTTQVSTIKFNFYGVSNTPNTYASSQNLTLGSGVSLVEYSSLQGDIKTAVDQGKIYAVLSETINGTPVTAIVPVGYSISSTNGENTISGGLVIKDIGNNEFVWVPVAAKNMAASYSAQNNITEPSNITGQTDSSSGYTYDTENEINYLYGTNYFGANPFQNQVSSSFAYEAHYNEMVTSVNTYGGFYIGRYETSIDGNGNIGSKVNMPVLTSSMTVKSGTNANTGTSYYYRWWGLYYALRNSNVFNNGSIVQTNMIWGQQWDKMISYFDSRSIDYSSTNVATLSTSGLQYTGQAEYTYNENTVIDKIFNIYDLRRNAYDFTAEAINNTSRVVRGNNHSTSSAAANARSNEVPTTSNEYGARLTMYIK